MVKTEITIGLDAHRNWVDVLVRRVLLNALVQELSNCQRYNIFPLDHQAGLDDPVALRPKKTAVSPTASSSVSNLNKP